MTGKEYTLAFHAAIERAHRAPRKTRVDWIARADQLGADLRAAAAAYRAARLTDRFS